MVGGVAGFDVRGDGGAHVARRELRLGELAPHLVRVHALRVLQASLDGLEALQQHFHGIKVQVELLENRERLLVQLVADGDLANLRAVERVQPVDVVHHARLVRLDGGEDEQVLQVGVVVERAVLQHDLFQQLDELLRHLRGHERLDGHGHLLRVLALGERGGHHLVDEVAAVRVVVGEHVRPEVDVHALHHVPRLHLEQRVLVRHLHELDVALASLVRHARQVWVALLAILAHHLAVVVLVGGQEVLRVRVAVDEDHAQRVVHVGVHRALGHEVLQERREHLQAVALAHLLHERAHGQQRAHGQNQVLQEILRALLIQQRAHHEGRVAGVHLLHVPLDVAHHVVLVQVRGEVAHEVEAVAHVNQRARVRQLRLHQEHLRLLGVVKVALARHALNLLDLARLGRRLDVLEVHLRVLRGGEERAEVEE